MRIVHCWRQYTGCWWPEICHKFVKNCKIRDSYSSSIPVSSTIPPPQRHPNSPSFPYFLVTEGGGWPWVSRIVTWRHEILLPVMKHYPSLKNFHASFPPCSSSPSPPAQQQVHLHYIPASSKEEEEGLYQDQLLNKELRVQQPLARCPCVPLLVVQEIECCGSLCYCSFRGRRQGEWR